MHNLSPVLLLLLLLPFWATALTENERQHEIHFAPGSSSATIAGKVHGYDYVTYTLRARAGQTMTVDMQTDHTASYFNVFPPGKGPGDAAIFIGSTAGNQFTEKLPADGIYTIQVYLMRSAARRNETANFSLTVNITPESD